MEAKLNAAFDAGQLEGLHSVLVLREGRNEIEAHFEGEDERWTWQLPVNVIDEFLVPALNETSGR